MCLHVRLELYFNDTFRSEFFTIHREKERAQKMITKDRKDFNICSGSTFAKVTGLEVCGEVSFTNASMVENAPYFPITGPMNAGIAIYKRDSSMTGYKFEARSTHVSCGYLKKGKIFQQYINKCSLATIYFRFDL